MGEGSGETFLRCPSVLPVGPKAINLPFAVAVAVPSWSALQHRLERQAEVHPRGLALHFLEVVAEVLHRHLQVAVAQQKLHLPDVEATLQPALRGEPAEAVERVAVACGVAQTSGLQPLVEPRLQGALLEGFAEASTEDRPLGWEPGLRV